MCLHAQRLCQQVLQEQHITFESPAVEEACLRQQCQSLHSRIVDSGIKIRAASVPVLWHSEHYSGTTSRPQSALNSDWPQAELSSSQPLLPVVLLPVSEVLDAFATLPS